jgi:DNA repair exonuclease SbcCD nuclease subunit
MKKTRIAFTADLHIGSASNIPGRLDEQQRVWEEIIHGANEAQVDAIIVGGDVFHRPKPTPNQMLAFIRPTEDAKAPIQITMGNHDSTGVAGESSPVHIMWWIEHHVEVADRILTVEIPDKLRVIHLPYVRRSWYPEAEESSIDQLVLDALRLQAHTLRDSLPAILVGHMELPGAKTPTGYQLGAKDVTIGLRDIEDLRVVCGLFGHIHQPQDLGDMIPIIYPGPPMITAWDEADLIPSWALVEIEEYSTGWGATIERKPIKSHMRWRTLRCAVTADGRLLNTWPTDDMSGDVARCIVSCPRHLRASIDLQEITRELAPRVHHLAGVTFADDDPQVAARRAALDLARARHCRGAHGCVCSVGRLQSDITMLLEDRRRQVLPAPGQSCRT